MATLEEVHAQREKMDQEYKELCERLTQEQDEKEIEHIQKLIRTNRYNDETLKYKELRIKLLNVKDNKERNELINSYADEAKAEMIRINERRKIKKIEFTERWNAHLAEKKRLVAEKRKLAEEERMRRAEERIKLMEERRKLAEEKKMKQLEEKLKRREERKKAREQNNEEV